MSLSSSFTNPETRLMPDFYTIPVSAIAAVVAATAAAVTRVFAVHLKPVSTERTCAHVCRGRENGGWKRK